MIDIAIKPYNPLVKSDDFLKIVLRFNPHNWRTPYVVHTYNGEHKGYALGTYCDSAEKAAKAFNRRGNVSSTLGEDDINEVMCYYIRTLIGDRQVMQAEYGIEMVPESDERRDILKWQRHYMNKKRGCAISVWEEVVTNGSGG